MKQLITFACITLICIGKINAQQLDYKYWDMTGEYAYSHKIIIPTLKNLITLVDLSQSDFISLMEHYGYSQDNEFKPSDYTFVAYSNLSIDFFLPPLNGLGTNTIEQSEIRKCVRIIGNLSHLSPRDALTNLSKELQPYYTGIKDGNDCFVIPLQEGGGYVFLIGSSDGYYEILCLHLDK